MRKKRETKYVTIKDVAEEAEVSIATVSRVLNNGRVRTERKRRVLDAMSNLNYMPNNSARNLASVNATKRVSLVVPSLQSFYIPFIEGFKSGLSLYKYEGVIETFNYDDAAFIDICERQKSNAEVRGIVQFTPLRELRNKNVISMLADNSEFEYKIDEGLMQTKLGLYFPTDKFVRSFFGDVVFANGEAEVTELESASGYDTIITNRIDTAFELINNGYTGKIKTIEKAQNVTVAFPQIETLNLDLYALGLYVSRYIIKDINEEDMQNAKISVDVK